MNNALFTSKTGLWETPQEFFDKLNREFDFTLDACATPENAKCINFYSPEQDACACRGRGAFGAIRRMADRLASGSKKRI